MISVIVPAYNAADFLGELLESVRLQTAAEFECIIVDDGSTDLTREVARSFVERDGRFRLLTKEKNAGVNAARNTGLDSAQGEFVYFLDADDFLESCALEVLRGELLDHPNLDAVVGLIEYVGPSGERRFRGRRGEVRARFMVDVLTRFKASPAIAWMLGNPLPIHALLWRRSVLERAGTFDESLTHWEEYEFFLRVAWAGPFTLEVVPQKIGYYRRHARGASQMMSTMSAGNELALNRFEARQRQSAEESVPASLVRLAHWVAQERARGRVRTDDQVEALLQGCAREVGISEAELRRLCYDSLCRTCGGSALLPGWASSRVTAAARGYDMCNALLARDWKWALGLFFDGMRTSVRGAVSGILVRC